MNQILFHWMTVAIRLDFMSRDAMIHSFDKESVYSMIQRQQIPVSGWPKLILEQFEENTNNNSTYHQDSNDLNDDRGYKKSQTH